MVSKNNEWILHVDGDAFFASCEVSRRPDLYNKPVVVGEERGAVVALTYSAKALGVERGEPIFKLKKRLPQVVTLSSHFELYRKICYNLQMIISPQVQRYECYSIDECFAVITGEQDEIKKRVIQIREEVHKKLGITYSFGVAKTKTLAKVASKLNKPKGLTFLFTDEEVKDALQKTKVENVWGIGWATFMRLKAYKIDTAYDFLKYNLSSVKKETMLDDLTTPHYLTRLELMGAVQFAVGGQNPLRKSLQATRKFLKNTNSKKIVSSELSRNLENAMHQLRTDKQYTKRVYFYVKSTIKGRGFSAEIHLPFYTNNEMYVWKHIEQAFDMFEIDNTRLYKSSGIVLTNLQLEEDIKRDLFNEQEDFIQVNKYITSTIDKIRERYGFGAISLLSSHESNSRREEESMRRHAKDNYEYGLPYPFLGVVS